MKKLPSWARRGQQQWKHRGHARPAFAVDPLPGQESVWDYPRPPRIEASAREVRVEAAGTLLCQTFSALRVLETASPPTFYVPWDAVVADILEPCPGRSACEWKGEARYFAIGSGGAVAWAYPEPFEAFERLRDYVAFYPGRVTCTVGGERVAPQAGGFYGGWVTSEIVGPLKGEPGSEGW